MLDFLKEDGGPILNCEIKILLKENDKEENRIGGTYLWDWKIAAKKIIENMLLEADMKPIYYSQKAYFLALRLKFTNEQVKKLAYDALCFNVKNYNDTINGKNTIHYTMQEGSCDYYSALFFQYLDLPESKNDKLPNYVNLPDCQLSMPHKTMFSTVSEDGHKLFFYSADEYHKRFGLTPLEEQNKSMTEEEKTKFKEYGRLLKEEIKKYEILYNKKEKKWTNEQREKFMDHMDLLQKEKGL